MSANVPARFDGTAEQAAANRLSHDFVRYGDEVECARCVCKPWHVAASYRCGVEPPRATVDAASAIADQAARFLSYASGSASTGKSS